MAEAYRFFCVESDGQSLKLRLRDNWIIDAVAEIDAELVRWRETRRNVYRVIITGEDLHALDLSGAWMLYRCCERLRQEGAEVDWSALESAHPEFVAQIAEGQTELCPPPQQRSRLIERLVETGRRGVQGCKDFIHFIRFMGQVFTVLGYCVLNPRKLRLPAIARHIDETGFQAIPIVSLLAFLISIVLAYQGTTQLSRFGAEIFTIDLVAISVLREMGVLLTAIMVAGRSGSAFAAEIGVMQLNQEVAAMQTLGINPMHALMVPRTLALVITLPILTLIADLVGLAGGCVVAVFALDIPFSLFMDRLESVVTLTHFLVGMAKAPVFAFMIAVIGIRQGFLVEHSAADVGRNTTRAVVQSIFAVIAIDALFSVVTTELGL